MFDLSIAHIARVSMHFLDHEDGNAEVHLTEEPLQLQDNDASSLLHQYTLKPFMNFEDYQSFTYRNGDASLNPLSIMASHMFSQEEPFHDLTKRIAKHLFQQSTHQSIKSGDLIVALLKDVTYEDEVIDAIGIWKAESKDDFLKLLYRDGAYDMTSDKGVNINKLDKGCIIFNTAASAGYVVASIDRTSSSSIWLRPSSITE